MTQAVSVPARRPGEMRVVAPICAAHFVSHYYMMILAPLFAFVRADYGVSYTDLGLALTAFNLVSALFQTPAGFLVDRVGARTVLIAGVALGAAAFAIAGPGQFVRRFCRHVRRRRSRQHRVPSGRLFAIVGPRIAGAHRPDFLVSHLCRHSRRRGRAGYASGDAQLLRLARRLCRCRHTGLRGACAPDRRALGHASPIGWRKNTDPATAADSAAASQRR